MSTFKVLRTWCLFGREEWNKNESAKLGQEEISDTPPAVILNTNTTY